MKSNLLGIFLAAFFACAVMPALAADTKPPQGKQAYVQPDPLMIYKQAGIDQDQEKKIRALILSFDNLIHEKIGRMKQLRSDMNTLSFQTDPDESVVMAKQAEMNKLNNEVSNERLKMMLKIRGIMTPPQKQKLVELMKQAMQSMTQPPSAGMPGKPHPGTARSKK